MDLKELIAAELDATRRRSLAIVDAVPDHEQVRQQSPLMSPLVWDLAHVGNYEELWLLRVLAGAPSTSERYDDMYNPFVHPRFTRANLPLLGPRESRAYIAGVRSRVVDVLADVELDPADKLLEAGFVYGMVVQHEQQHDETMVATRQLMGERGPALGEPEPAPPASPVEPAQVRIPGGRYVVGTDVEPWAYDNERPAHEVDLDAFWIDTTPVSNRRFAEFIAAGGYDDPRLWTPDGWAWRTEAGLAHPQFWRPEGEGSWSVLRFGRRIPVDPEEPVQHVCWYEADAYARWAQKRLPTEHEWEVAASCSPAGGKLRYPWGNDDPTPGRANLGQRRDGPAPIGSLAGGASPWGCHHMIGDVWEWTASDFAGYPGFEVFPYREYSEAFFGSYYKVLRGGSWATQPVAIRATFRNWDYPIRRQIFAGFRCARDA